MYSNDARCRRQVAGGHCQWTPTNARVLAAVLALLCIGMIGCGDGRPRRVPVSGQVVIDGKPLTLGYIRFVPNDARPSGGDIGPDGRFALTCFDGGDGAVPGRHRVEVIAREPLGSDAARLHAPKKYLNVDTSGLEVEVTGPTDSLVIELSWEGGEPYIEYVGR